MDSYCSSVFRCRTIPKYYFNNDFETNCTELIKLSLEEKGMTQRQLANEIGVSSSRANDYLSDRSEPRLKSWKKQEH